MEEHDHQVTVLLTFLSAETGKTVEQAEIDDEQHEPEKLRFRVRYEGVAESEQIEVDYAKLRDALVAAKAVANAERPEEVPPPQASRAMTIARGEEFRENARKVIIALSGVDLAEDSGVDAANAAIEELGLGLRVVHGPPACADAGVWVTQLGVVSDLPGDRRAGCSFQFGALAEDADAALKLLTDTIRETRI